MLVSGHSSLKASCPAMIPPPRIKKSKQASEAIAIEACKHQNAMGLDLPFMDNPKSQNMTLDSGLHRR